MKKARTTVALVDPRWDGHHPTYFREFLSSLLRAEARVIALCPEPGEFAVEAKSICEEAGMDAAEWVVVEGLVSPRKSFIFPGKEHDPLSTLVRWFQAGSALRRAERRCGWRADLVFFAWLDSYLRFLPHWLVASAALRRRWGGLYFRNHHLRSKASGWRGKLMHALRVCAKGDYNLRGRDCAGVGVLDERFERELEELCRKPVIHFPDITDVALPEEEPALVREIKERANGRRIIGMVGLEKRKGFLTLLRAAVKVSKTRPWYFVFGGRFHGETFTDEQRQWVEVVERTANRYHQLDNLYIDLEAGRLSDEEFNSLIASFDIVYAAYEDFPGSSNTLTKAAYFEKPVLVSKGECMEKRVSEYGMGICIDQADVGQCIGGIERLIEGRTLEEKPLESRFAEYRKNHSRERLDEVFREALSHA